ncbi:Putative disease resistance protein At4g11170 [Arabidopsis thaliana] [Rhizoctonia solani]|uniref:Putative disease resistance protein At4g11170 [Arabidopsis thaliana] n=1 Tax=Rhizoctonia solani TaxID=456999 RepID=A0A0K6G7P5_9AGAM|nr:Putative disease resistance protein At4g11170 [Arabidopsis thaliana] [Rhizoctonia solani]
MSNVANFQRRGMVDRKQIAVDLAVASQALAAAADALADAAKAISDTGRVSGRRAILNVPDGLVSSVSQTDNAVGVSLPTQVVHPPDRVNESSVHQELESQNEKPRPEVVLLSASGVIPPGSNSQSGVTSIGAPATPTPDASHRSIKSKAKIGNKLDSDPSPRHPDVSVPIRNPESSPQPTRDSNANSSLENMTRLLQAMKSYPTIPLARNYISLDKVTDALAFVAYLALQVNKIICLIPDQYMNVCSDLLKFLSRPNVYKVNTYHYLQDIYSEFGTTPGADSYYILLEPSLLATALSLKHIPPDCFVHWGQPIKGNNHSILNSFPASVKICVVLVGERNLNRRVQGIVPYSDEVLNTCFRLESPFQLLCQIAARPVLGVDSPSQTSGLQSIRPPTTSNNPVPSVSSRQTQTNNPIPSGNYYIVLNTEQDRDIIPIISYIALNSKKTMCYIPSSKNMVTYKHLIEIAYSNTILSASVTHTSIEAAVAGLKLVKGGILLRNATKDWNSFLSDSLVDCLVYCGVPQAKLKKFHANRGTDSQLDSDLDSSLSDSSMTGILGALSRLKAPALLEDTWLLLSLDYVPLSILEPLPSTALPTTGHSIRMSVPATAHDPTSAAGSSKSLASGKTKRRKNGAQLNVTQLLEEMKFHPTIPFGRNYICLDQASDALAFIAYMALQCERIICFIPDEILGAFLESLEYILHANIHCINSDNEIQYISTALGIALVPNLPNILIIPCRMMRRLHLRNVDLDCVMHWGIPPNASPWINNVVNTLSSTTSASLLVMESCYFNGLSYRVAPYSGTVKATLSDPDSPLQLLRLNCREILKDNPLSRTILEAPKSHLPPLPLNHPPAPSKPKLKRNARLFPPGHYYINSKQRVFCRIPEKESPARYKKLIGIAGVRTQVAVISRKARSMNRSMNRVIVKDAAERLPVEDGCVLLNDMTEDWGLFPSNSGLDTIIHCGVPTCKGGLRQYYSACKERVTHSYLIISRLDYPGIELELSSTQHIQIEQHPHLQSVDTTRLGSLLHSLRVRLSTKM